MIAYAYRTLAVALVTLASAEAVFVFVSEPYVFHMVLDLFLAILYIFLGWKLTQTLKLYSSSHYKRTRGWISYITTILVISFLARFSIQVWAYSNRKGFVLRSVTVEKLLFYGAFLMVAEALPIASLVGFLYLHKPKHKRSIIIPQISSNLSKS